MFWAASTSSSNLPNIWLGEIGGYIYRLYRREQSCTTGWLHIQVVFRFPQFFSPLDFDVGPSQPAMMAVPTSRLQ